MECTGTLKDVSRNWLTKKWNITFEVDEDITSGIEQIRDKLLTLNAKVYRKKRSLDANGMYWKLLTQLAEVMKVSKPAMHNMLLRRYGQLEMVEGQCIPLRILDTVKAENIALEAMEYHIKPTSQTITVNGKTDRVYFLIKGSHEYDTREFSELLSGLVSECKEADIPTMSPEEFGRLMAAYESQRRDRNG